MPTRLTLSIIKYGSRVKWSNPGKGVAPSPTPWCSSYRNGSLRVTLDYGRQLLLTYQTAWPISVPRCLRNYKVLCRCSSARLFIFFIPYRLPEHIYIYIYIYIYISSSSSSYRAGSTDIPDPLSPFLPIVHRPR